MAGHTALSPAAATGDSAAVNGRPLIQPAWGWIIQSLQSCACAAPFLRL